MKPNTASPFRRAFYLPVLMLLVGAPVLWMFVEALQSGNGGYIGAVGFFAIPVLVAMPVAFCGEYYHSRKRRNEEFRER